MDTHTLNYLTWAFQLCMLHVAPTLNLQVKSLAASDVTDKGFTLTIKMYETKAEISYCVVNVDDNTVVNNLTAAV